MDDDVELVCLELILQLRRPEALAAKVVERRRLVAVAGGCHSVDGERVGGQHGLQRGDDEVGLGEGERRVARADPDGRGALCEA